ncbi:hypothetical protein ACYSNR_11570 [Enterococcus sp. LJL128]
MKKFNVGELVLIKKEDGKKMWVVITAASQKIFSGSIFGCNSLIISEVTFLEEDIVTTISSFE